MGIFKNPMSRINYKKKYYSVDTVVHLRFIFSEEELPEASAISERKVRKLLKESELGKYTKRFRCGKPVRTDFLDRLLGLEE